jgi:hypothetical protein
MIGVLPWLVRWAHRAGPRDFWPALAAWQQAGQEVMLGRLSLHVCL